MTRRDGRVRYEHRPSGDAAERAEGAAGDAWLAEVAALMAGRPGAAEVRETARGPVIMLARDVPGGPSPAFSVGERVAAVDGLGRTAFTSWIVGGQSALPMCGMPESYLLDDGSQMAWDGEAEAWRIDGSHLQVRRVQPQRRAARRVA